MKLCPYCGEKSLVVRDTREQKDFVNTYRNYYCKNCHKEFTTVESIYKNDMIKISKNNKIEYFSTQKFVNSFCSCCDLKYSSISLARKIANSFIQSMYKSDKSDMTINIDEFFKFVLDYLYNEKEYAFLVSYGAIKCPDILVKNYKKVLSIVSKE